MSIVTQCRLLRVARSTLYYRPAPASEDDLRLMRRIDADSVDRDQPFRPIVITCLGDRDHVVHPAGGGPGGRHDGRQVAATDA
jgi:hypothetical protein